MTTAEAIEGMTDAGKFEILATRVLRYVDDDCRLLEHMGVNAAGKTISNSIDSFSVVPSTNPPRFVMAAFTTDKVQSLERKWLFDHKAAPNAKRATAANDGDLVKAARRAETLRREHPNATFVVYLCTNKQPNDDLMAIVYNRGQQLGLEVRFLARSHLRDFLDTTPDGQWLRKEHLGIQAERLSLPLLQDLSRKSLQQYGKEFLFTLPETFVATSSAGALAASVDSPKSVHVVTGASGSGKSVACHQVLREHLAKSGIGLWIPGEIAGRAASLEEAICLTLRSLHPTVEPDAGAAALRLQTSSRRLFLIVDDINRGGSPSESLRRVVAWGRPANSDKEGSSTPSHVVIVPAWDLFWAPLNQQFCAIKWLASVPVTQMSEAEAMACLVASLGPDAKHLAEADRLQVVAALGYDPILIAMYADLAQGQAEPGALHLAHDVIDRFVATVNAEAAASGSYLQDEYGSALADLAMRLLAERDLYPRWDHVEHWLSAKAVQAIRELARLKKICRVTDRGGESRFEFRHDRILEYYLARALQAMFADPESNSYVLSDPFYASFVGRALTSAQLSDELLRWVQQHTPLALISAFRFSASTNPAAIRITEAAKAWLRSASEDRHTPPVVLFEAYRLLEETDSPRLLDVTQSLSRHRLVARARLANGDAAAGCVEFSDTRWFAPAVNDRGLDAVLSRVLHRYQQKLVADCAVLLQRSDLPEAERRGALVLAGFIGDASLAAAVRAAWNATADKINQLLPALWAGFRCGVDDPSAVLEDMMAVWASLPADDQGRGLSQRGNVAEELQFAVRRGVPESVLRYLIARARTDDALRWSITFTLEHLDHPLVVRFLVEEAANTDRQVKETGGFAPWLMILRDNWDPINKSRGKRLSVASVEVLRACWESETSDQQLRETGFRFWVYAVDDVDVLRSISPDHPQFHQVLWRRAMLGDVSVVPMIKPLLATDEHWFNVIGKVWTQECRDILDQALLKLEKNTPMDHTGGMTNTHYMLARLIRDIPSAEAQPLLEKHWGHLRYSPLFVQAALYIGTPDCTTSAGKAILDFPSATDPFAPIGMFFGFFTTGLMDRLGLQHLEVLLPYLSQLDDHALSVMAEFCERRGYREWSKVHLKPEFDRRSAQLPKVAKEKHEYVERLGRHHFPSDADLLEDLDWIEQQGKHYPGRLYHWSEEFARRQDEHERWRRLLEEWLVRSPTVERFRLVADAILEHGTRKDFDLLSKHVVSGDLNEVERLRANAKFGVMRRSLH